MNRADYIHKKTALFLLVIFALSITPKIFFHDAFAHHSDGLVCQHPDKNKPCIHNEAFHCQFDDLVVTAPYLPQEQDLSLDCPAFAFHYVCSPATPLYGSSFLHNEDRGPPSAV